MSSIYGHKIRNIVSPILGLFWFNSVPVILGLYLPDRVPLIGGYRERFLVSAILGLLTT